MLVLQAFSSTGVTSAFPTVRGAWLATDQYVTRGFLSDGSGKIPTAQRVLRSEFAFPALVPFPWLSSSDWPEDATAGPLPEKSDCCPGIFSDSLLSLGTGKAPQA